MKRIVTTFASGIFTLLMVECSLLPVNGQTVTTTNSKSTGTTQTANKSVKTGQQVKQPAGTSKQVSSKSQQAASKVSKPPVKNDASKKAKNPNVITIGKQDWAIANLNVNTFRNGDTIPEVKSNREWVAAGEAGKPAWCYYNNDPSIGKKYGKLYNWFAVNDPRGLAPDGWIIPTDEDWAKLTYQLGGSQSAGIKMKSTVSWNDGDNGTNESGFNAFPSGYRVENGAFVNIGTTAAWWSATEAKAISAYDRYVALGGKLNGSNSPKQRGESIRCLVKTGK